jgi:ribosomal protein L35
LKAIQNNRKQRKYLESLNELDKTLKIQEKKLGKEHPTTKHTQNNIRYLKNEMVKNNKKGRK